MAGATGRADPLSGIHAGNGWRAFEDLLGGVLILAVWMALWGWMAVGVVRPLSGVALHRSVPVATGAPTPGVVAAQRSQRARPELPD